LLIIGYHPRKHPQTPRNPPDGQQQPFKHLNNAISQLTTRNIMRTRLSPVASRSRRAPTPALITLTLTLALLLAAASAAPNAPAQDNPCLPAIPPAA